MATFTFWWSIISTIISLILMYVAIWQYLEGKNAKKRQKAQVKIWMQDALGISEGLKIVLTNGLTDKFSTPRDVANAIWGIQSSAFALYQSLYEERCITEEEYIERQKKIFERLEERHEQQDQSIAPDTISPNQTHVPPSSS